LQGDVLGLFSVTGSSRVTVSESAADEEQCSQRDELGTEDDAGDVHGCHVSVPSFTATTPIGRVLTPKPIPAPSPCSW
jgi:hypothetical protein